jgi:catecholate siderophore receptor
MVLAASVSGWAQTTPASATSATQGSKTLSTVTVKEKAEARDTVRATSTSIGKGQQALRDIPQSITVVTEKIIQDRHLDSVKDVLRNTAGVTFQAAEGGEEDIRLRGFSLATTGDIFIDGMRDPAFYDRDTFNNDRVELLRGSASMLFGRGSTGGAVNQVSKAPRLVTEHDVTTTVGSHGYKRAVGDFNIRTGEAAALRINAMANTGANNGAGSSIDKKGIAAAYRVGIDEKDEFLASMYYLDNKNGINYGLPWIKPKASDTSSTNTIIGSLDPTAYYGMASDHSYGTAQWLALKHTHRFGADSELQTQVRKGRFSRDLRASAIRFAGVGSTSSTNPVAVDLGNFGPSTRFTRGLNLKIQDVDTLHMQSDFTNKFNALGVTHSLTTGVDFAQEKKAVDLARTAAQGGVDLTKPTTTAGTPFDGAAVNEGTRVLRDGNDFASKAYGLYAQDLIQVAPLWKVLLGLRYDNMAGNYNAYAIPTAAAGPVTTTRYTQKIEAASKRVGLLYQPSDVQSYHFSYGTSFNTSGDAYSYNAQSANTPPESSENMELGARFESANKQLTTRIALFRSTKSNERNTDPDTAATRLLLSGKRHSAGVELDVMGRINRQWEIYASYMWMPVAVVDQAASTATTVGNRVGDRPGLSPRHSGTVWNTYQFTPKLRLGAGINFRSKQAPADVTAPAWEAPGFVTADLMGEYAVTDDISVKANLNNISNKLYADSLYRGHYTPGAGRMLYAGMSIKF